jgi:hypothetical protein
MGSTFRSPGSPGARLNLALLDSAYFCYVIPCLSITWIFMGAIWVGMKKGRPDCSSLPVLCHSDQSWSSGSLPLVIINQVAQTTRRTTDPHIVCAICCNFSNFIAQNPPDSESSRPWLGSALSSSARETFRYLPDCFFGRLPSWA